MMQKPAAEIFSAAGFFVRENGEVLQLYDKWPIKHPDVFFPCMLCYSTRSVTTPKRTG
jgi:hypothetical protein